jgi:hypothetical protein
MKHEQYSEQNVLRVAPTLRDEIERAASSEGRSLANMTRRILERWHAERSCDSAAIGPAVGTFFLLGIIATARRSPPENQMLNEITISLPVAHLLSAIGRLSWRPQVFGFRTSSGNLQYSSQSAAPRLH